MSETLEALMLALMRIPGARVGAGPLDPHCEEPHLIGVVRKLIDNDVVLASDADYVTFLKYYAGAAIASDAALVHIWGPSRAVAELHWDHLALTHDSSYAPICVAQLPGEDRVEFYLSSASHRRAGVYWARRTDAHGLEVEWHCAGFLALLAQIVRTQGTFRAGADS
jgi:hypothetical protein